MKKEERKPLPQAHWAPRGEVEGSVWVLGGLGLDGQERLGIQGFCQGCLGAGSLGLRKIPVAPRGREARPGDISSWAPHQDRWQAPRWALGPGCLWGQVIVALPSHRREGTFCLPPPTCPPAVECRAALLPVFGHFCDVPLCLGVSP